MQSNDQNNTLKLVIDRYITKLNDYFQTVDNEEMNKHRGFDSILISSLRAIELSYLRTDIIDSYFVDIIVTTKGIFGIKKIDNFNSPDLPEVIKILKEFYIELTGLTIPHSDKLKFEQDEWFIAEKFDNLFNYDY